VHFDSYRELALYWLMIECILQTGVAEKKSDPFSANPTVALEG